MADSGIAAGVSGTTSPISFSSRSSTAPAKVGPEFLVNTTTASDQAYPSITGLANGGFVVTWLDYGGSGGDISGSAIRAQVFDIGGTKQGPEVLVNTTTVDRQEYPSITALSNGGFVVTWEDHSRTGGDTSGTSIRAQVFDARGAKLGAEFLVNTTTEGYQVTPSITSLGSSGFVATWMDVGQNGGDTSGTAVRAQVFDFSGAKLGAEFLVNTTTAGYQGEPAITALANGAFVVTWQDASQTGGDTSFAAIRAQVFDASGAKLGAEFLVNTATEGAQGYPSITALDNGGFVVTWMDWNQTGGDTSESAIRAQVFDSGGTKQGPEVLVNTTTLYDQYFPEITGLANGAFIVTWADESQTGGDTSGYAIRAQVFNASGAKLGAEFLVNTTTLYGQYTPRITGLANGGFVVTWADESRTGGDTSNWAIRAQVFATGAIVAPTSPSDAELELAAKHFAYNLAEGVTAYGWTVSDASIDNGTFRAVLLTSPGKEPILAIRGTIAPNTPLGAADWVNNSDPASTGFLEALSNQSEILALIAANPGIHIVGHSQGGSQAQLIAAWATDAGLTIGNVYTFNSPGISTYHASIFDDALAGDVKHFISSGDVVSMVGDTFLGGAVHFYDIVGIKNWYNPFSLVGAAHTGHTALQTGGYSGVLGSGEGYSIPGILTSTALSSPLFSYLSAGGKFDAEYMSFLIGVASATSVAAAVGLYAGFPASIKMPKIAFDLAFRASAEELRDQVGMKLFPILMGVTLTADDFKLIKAAGAAIAEWGALAAKAINWTAATWAGIAANFTAEVWDSVKDWTAAAIEGLANWTSATWNKVTDWTSDTWASVKDWTVEVWQGANSWVDAKFDAIAKFGGDVLDAIDAKLDALNSAITDFGQSVYQGLLDNASAVGNWLGIGSNNVVQATGGNLTAQGTNIVVATSGGGATLQSGSNSMYVLGNGIDRAVLTGGGNGIFGSATGLHSDTISGFGASDRLVIIGSSIDASQLRKEKGSAILHIDSDGDGTEDTVIKLEGDYDLDRFYVTQIEDDTEIVYAPVVLNGTAASDGLEGSPMAETILGLAGNDTIDGGASADSVEGGDGDDSIDGGTGSDRLIGGKGNDTIDGGDEADTVDGGDGNDRLFGGVGHDKIVGGAGNDRLDGAEGDDTLEGGIGENTLYGGAGADQLVGGSAGDRLEGGVGSDTLTGGAAADLFMYAVGSGADKITDYSASAGDRVVVSRNLMLLDETYAAFMARLSGLATQTVDKKGIIINFGGGDVLTVLGATAFSKIKLSVTAGGSDAHLGSASADGIVGHAGEEMFLGGNGNDVLTGNGGDDTIYGETGRDRLVGGIGADQIYGGNDADTLDGGLGNDTLYGETGNDSITGQAENDTIAGADFLDGGVGRDTLSGGHGDDTLLGGDGADSVLGGVGNDLLYGWKAEGSDTANGDGKDTLDGGLGNDTIYGGGEADGLFGAAGNDLLRGDAGNDTVNGGVGDDTIFGGADNDSILGGLGNDSLDGGDGRDRIDGSDGDDTATGGSGADTLLGGKGNDSLLGLDGNDVLDGGDGNDWQEGDTGADRLIGGKGVDRLNGGAGDDTLTGGDGADAFVFTKGFGRDLITDFSVMAGDRLVLDENWFADGDILGGDGVYVNPYVFTQLAAWTTQTANKKGVIINFGNGDVVTINGVTAFSQIQLSFTQSGDVTQARAGNSVVLGGVAADIIGGSDGNNRIDSGDGQDTVYARLGNDTVAGGVGRDWIWGEGGNDSLSGGSGDDLLYGGDQDDTIYGGADNDRLWGDAGADLMFGDAGNDTLTGGAGNDTMTGGLGADYFVFANGYGSDSISDISLKQGDILYLNDDLFSEVFTLADALSRAIVSNSNIILNFGDGDILKVAGAVSVSQLSSTIRTGTHQGLFWEDTPI